MEFPPTTDGPEISENAYNLVHGIIEADQEAIITAVTKIVDGGLRWIVATVYGMSKVTLGIAGMPTSSSIGTFGMMAMNRETGEMVSADSVNIPKEQVDAVRLLALAGNDDHDMVLALARVYWEEGGEPLYELLFCVAQLTVQALEQRHEQHCPVHAHHNMN